MLVLKTGPLRIDPVDGSTDFRFSLRKDNIVCLKTGSP